MTAIVQQVHGQGAAAFVLPNPAGANHTLVAVLAERGGSGGLSWPYAAEGWIEAPDGVSASGGGDGVVVIYKYTVGGELSMTSNPLVYISGSFYEVDELLTVSDHATATGTGFTLSSGAAVAPAIAAFSVGIGGQGVGGGYDSVAGAVHYAIGAGWTEDHDNATIGGGHPTVVTGHRLDSGTFSFEATNQLPSGDAWVAQIVTFLGVVPPPDPGPIVDVYDPDDVYLATLPAKDVRIRPELNDVGSGAFKINRYADEATPAVLRKGNYVRVTIPQIDTEPIFGFFLDEGDFELVATNERGGEDLSFSGHGSLSYWQRAIWLAESFLVPWWPGWLPDPEPTDIGAVSLAAGYYWRFFPSGTTSAQRGTTAGTYVSSRTRFHTGGFTAYFDKQINVHPSLGSTTLITIVRLSSGSRAGWWVGKFASGVTRYAKSAHYRFGNSVLMESIDDGDKPGQVVRAMYDEAFAADRPIHPIPLMTVDFDSTTDSNGDPWSTTAALAAVSAELGDDYLSTIAKLIGTGVLEVETGPDLDMHAYNAPLGTDRSSGSFATGKVRFVKGTNIADDLVRELSSTPVGTFAEVLGPNEGDVGRATIVVDEPPREISVRGDSSDVAALEALGEAELERRLLHSDSIGFNVATPKIGQEDELAGLYLPGPAWSARGNYWPGDVVTLDTGTSEFDFNDVALRVAAITIWFNEAGDLRVSVELNSIGGGIPDGSDGSAGGGGSSSASGGGGSGTFTGDIYQLRDERDQAGGYPSLDEDGRIDPLEISTSWKPSVRLAVTDPVAIGTDLVDGGTLDGLPVEAGDDVLLTAQSDPAENGVYPIPESGSAVRRDDLSLPGDFLGAVVLVREGTSAGFAYRTTNTTEPDVDTDAIDWAVFNPPSVGDPALDTAVWMPLTSVVAGEPVLVWDADDSLVPTLIPLE